MKYEILGFGVVAMILSIGLHFGRFWLGFIPALSGQVMFWISLGAFGVYGLIVLILSLKKFVREMRD